MFGKILESAFQQPQRPSNFLDDMAQKQKLIAAAHMDYLNQLMRQGDVADIPSNHQILAAKAKYADQNQLATLNQMLANTGHINAETAAIPQRLDIERGNLGLRGKEFDLNNMIKNLQYSPDKIAAELSRIKSETDKNNAIAQKNNISAEGQLPSDTNGNLISVYMPKNKAEAQTQLDAIRQLRGHINNLKTYGIEQTAGLNAGPFGGWMFTDSDAPSKYGSELAQGKDKFVKVQNIRVTDKSLKTAEQALARDKRESAHGYSSRLENYDNELGQRENELVNRFKLGGIPLGASSEKSLQDRAIALLKKRGHNL